MVLQDPASSESEKRETTDPKANQKAHRKITATSYSDRRKFICICIQSTGTNTKVPRELSQQEHSAHYMKISFILAPLTCLTRVDETAPEVSLTFFF